MGLQCNVSSRVTFSPFTWTESNGDTWRDIRRSHGWPFEVFERSRQSLAHSVGKNENERNVWSMVYYSNRIRPIAVLLNFGIGAATVLLIYFLVRTAYCAFTR